MVGSFYNMPAPRPRDQYMSSMCRATIGNFGDKTRLLGDSSGLLGVFPVGNGTLGHEAFTG